MSQNQSCKQLWTVVNQLCLLSHRQAMVEHGFSVIKDTEVENVEGSTFAAKRMVCDHVQSVSGIDPGCWQAWCRWQLHLSVAGNIDDRDDNIGADADVMLLQPNVEELDKSVNERKKLLMDAKLKAKEPSAAVGATPPTTSRNVTPDKSSNFSPAMRPDVRRLKSEDEKSDSSFGLDANSCYCILTLFGVFYWTLIINLVGSRMWFETEHLVQLP